MGCSAEKIVQRKDQRAVNRVGTNIDLTNQVVNKWLQFHPFKCDSSQPVFLQGKPIIIPISLSAQDSLRLIKKIDSLKNIIGNNQSDVDTYYMNGYKDALIEHPPTKQIDSIKTTTTNTFEENRWKDSANKYKGDLKFQQGITTEKESSIISLKKYIIYLILAFVVSTGGLIASLFIKLKNPIKL